MGSLKHSFLKVIVVMSLGLFSVSCAQQMNQTTGGALAGSALGAGLGAIIGNQTGSPGAGIAIGAAAGAVSGGLLGRALDNRAEETKAVEAKLNAQQSEIEQNRILIDELKKRGADVRPSSRGVVVNLPDILFDFGKAELTSGANMTMEEISTVVRSVHGRLISVEGHTDSIGTVSYNESLSEDRARSVARKLEQEGVPRKQMSVKGFGEGAPIATNNTEAGRARNRRVEIIIENQDPSIRR